MKKLLTLILCLVMGNVSKAQLIIYQEIFDEVPSYILYDWGLEYTGSVPWEVGYPGTVGACMLPVGGVMSVETPPNKVACIADCGPMFNPNNANVLMYTPHISLSGITGAWLKYDSYYEQYTAGGITETATVEVSTDTGTTWTVVQIVPANPIPGAFCTWYIDLSAYNNVPNLQIGFRYADGGGWLMGWAVDNVTVFKPYHKDLALLSVTPIDTMLSYVTIGQSYQHSAQVYNAGLDTIHNFTLNYQVGTGPVQSSIITGVSLPPFSTTSFTHPIPDTLFSLGTFKVAMWVTLDSDEFIHNDTAITYLRGAENMPLKRLVIESEEGTWNGWCPRSMYYMHTVPALDVNASLISIHYGDPMEDSAYNDFLFRFNYDYVPNILFDRRKLVPFDSFFNILQTQNQYFGFAKIDLDGSVDGTNVTVNANVTPAIDLHGDYRLALIITENGVTGADSPYAQVNNYAGGVRGPMGGYEAMANPIPASTISYDYVARQAVPDPVGAPGSLPGDMYAGSSYSYTFNTTVKPEWQQGGLIATVMLVRHDDSVVLNSAQLPYALTAKNVTLNEIRAQLAPNPSDNDAKLYFTLAQNEYADIYITDISGRTIYNCPINNFSAGRNVVSLPVQNLTSGIYIATIRTAEGNKSLKLEVLH